LNQSVKHKLILASSSPRRQDLLRQIHITPDLIVPAHIDESEIKGETPRMLCARLALAKARHVAAQNPGYFVLGADTVVACGARTLPKTETLDEARACLERLSGRRHHVYGGIALIAPDGSAKTKISDTVVQFKRLSADEIAAYLESSEWRGVAGGYAIQGLAASFIKSIRGSYSNVVGLCVYDTMRLLRSTSFFHKS
jgi:septum formation protein